MRVWERTRAQLEAEQAVTQAVPAQVGGRGVLLVRHREAGIAEDVLPPDAPSSPVRRTGKDNRPNYSGNTDVTARTSSPVSQRRDRDDRDDRATGRQYVRESGAQPVETPVCLPRSCCMTLCRAAG